MNELHKYCPEIERWHMDPIWDIFSADSVQRYPQKEPFDEIEDRTAVIIHSSGTTGLPKPVRISHGYLATLFYMQELPVPEGRETTQLFIHEKGHLRFQSSPMFHFMGLVCISECIFFRTPFLLAPDRPLTTDLFSQIMSLENPPKWGLIAPFILEQLCASEKGRKALSKLSSVNFGSAPLSADAGKTLSSLVQLQQLFGSSETGYAANLRCEDPEDWNYLEWVPAFGTRMDDAGDGLFELVLTRTKSRRCHGIFHTDPDLTEYKTGDLFRAHDSKSGLWLYQGRGDDIIVLTNGEKFNPTEAEKAIESHSLVNHAAILGQDKFQPSLLVEPNWRDLPDDWTIEWLQQALQSKIDDANALLPGHGKIFHSHVAFASEDKPFALSPKGTLRRREITKTYESVIDQLYTHDNQSAKGLSEAQIPKLGGSSLNEIEQWIQDVISNIISLKTVNLDDEVVALGMDSLQVVRLIQVLQDTVDAMKAPTDQRWTNALIYDLETPRRIANSLHHQLNGATAGSDEAEPHQNAVSREDMLARYTWEQSQYLSCGGTRVILTGSTGELGSFLLDRLLRDPSITQITCLNRSADAAERQLQSFRQKQLSSFWLTDTTRVTFKQAKLHEPHLGLDPDTYKRLEKDTSVIIHNAWPVNFNQNLASFEPHLAGVRRLLNLAEHSALQPEFHFVSSISTVAAQSGDAGQRILERPQDPSSVLPQGYAESKFVAERLCEISSKRSGAKIAIHRVGQLGGPSSLSAGMWNMRDWFPSLVRSSLTMEKLPDSLGSMQVDWLPIVSLALI
jgi:acyl-CoA synthetase (AMP-forming)/AMP-acid ligase II/acyl carrier protein